MSVINLLVEASACLLPWVSLFICTPALIMAVAEREEAGTFYTELASLQSSFNYCCYAIVRLTLKMEWDLKSTATNTKHFLETFFNFNYFVNWDSWVQQNRSRCFYGWHTQQQTVIWQWIPELCTVLCVQVGNPLPAWGSCLKFLHWQTCIYESDVFVPFDVMNTPKLTHFSRATSTRANKIRTSRENNKADYGLPANLPWVILVSDSFYCIIHAFIKATICGGSSRLEWCLELWTANLK